MSDNDVYAGEELTVTYYIYINARSSITDYRLNGATQVPAFDGFYAEDIDVSHVQVNTRPSTGSSSWCNRSRRSD